MKLTRQGYIYYLFSVFLVSLVFLAYVCGDYVVKTIECDGWLFYVMSCLSHSSLLCLILFLVFFLPFALFRLRRIASFLIVSVVSILAFGLCVNMQVYRIYRFHINGFIINMLTGPNARDIFDFDVKLYAKESILLFAIIGVSIMGWKLSGWIANKWQRKYTIMSVSFLLLACLVANALFVYGSFVVKPSILKTAKFLPYYFPLSASSMLEKLGFERGSAKLCDVEKSSEMKYPLHAVTIDESKSTKPNVVFILIDAWSKRALTEEVMPKMWKLAHEEQWYQNHVSSSNGTCNSVFGIFTGIEPHYFSTFEVNRMNPVLVEQLLERGYDFRVYPSASIENPPFNRILFHEVPNLRVKTDGGSSYDRDLKIKEDLIRDLPELKQNGKPFFSFIFFDLLHAYSLPKEHLSRFQPSWEYGDFTKLNNDMDPTPFWNLYRNSAFQVDRMVDELICKLKELDLYDNSLIFITGDHGQEYNENHKNYWGHNSNFSKYQIGIPLIVHRPKSKEPAMFSHRTSHYDFVPTILNEYLGVTNPIDDYSSGYLLTDTTSRNYHYVGNETRFAFILDGDTILTKEGTGYVDVTDENLNPIKNYKINPKDFERYIKRLNRFYICE